MQKLQDSVFALVKTTNLSPAVFSFLQPTDDSGDKTPLGGILKDTKHGWLALGPKFCVVDLRTGMKVAARTFGATLSNNATVTSVVELPTPLTENSQQLIISLQCDDISIIVVLNINGSQILRCIQTDVVVTKLAICDIAPDGIFKCYNGIVIAGTNRGEIFVFDLNKAILKKALKDISQGYEHLIQNEMKPTNLSFLPLDAIHRIDEQRKLALEHDHHLAVLLNENSFIDGQYIFRNPDGTVRMKADRDHIRVTVLEYIPQTGSVAMGFNFGAFQIWNLMTMDLEFTSQVNIDCLPVTHFGFQEPCDDPRSFCYLWVIFSVIDRYEEEEFPLAVMYSLTYHGKRMLSDTKCFYEDFTSARIRFQIELSPVNETSLLGGKCISCHTCSIKSALGDDGEDTLNLCQLVWECWAENTNSPMQYGMLLFDLDQWYKDQMPGNYKVESNAFLSASWWSEMSGGGSVALHARLDPASVMPYTHPNRLEEHFYPNSLQYNCICLNTSEVYVLGTSGIQRQIISSMESVGPTVLLHPARLHAACAACGLAPLYAAPCAFTQEDQRRYLLSVALEARLVRFLKRCAHDWATGSHSGVGCTLPFLVDWCWKRAIELKESAKDLTAPLFVSTSLPDRNIVRCIEDCVQQLTQLTGLMDAILTKCCNLVVPEALSEMEERHKGIGTVSLYFQVVQWFLRVGLLPERVEGSGAIPYPTVQLYGIYNRRRLKLNRIQDNGTIEENSAHRPCTLLYIDQLLEQEFGGERIYQMWVRGGSECQGLYPPPSLYALLRLYLLPDIAEEHKHSLVLYLLVDYSMLYDDARYETVVRRLMQFPTMFGLSNTAIKATQAFWHLDHRDFDFALDQLQCLTGNTLSEWQHNVVLSSLLAQKKTQAALQYLHVRKPAPIQNIKDGDYSRINDYDKLDDWQSCCNLYLARGLVFEALDVIRMCVQNTSSLNDKTHVLNMFFRGCRNTGNLSKVLSVSFLPAEEEVFIKYLENCNEPQTSNILIMYYLQQARYLEAERYNAKLRHIKPKSKDNNASAESLFDSTDREGARDNIVEAMCAALPSIAETVAKCAFFQGDEDWHVDAPKPMSMYFKANPPKNSFTYKSSFIQNTIQNASETWVNRPKIRKGLKRMLNIEETPFICTPKLSRSRSIYTDQQTDSTPPKRARLNLTGTPRTPRSAFRVSDKLNHQMEELLDMPEVQSPVPISYERPETPHSILKPRTYPASEAPSPICSRYQDDSDDDLEMETASNHTHYSDTTNKHLRFTIPTPSELCSEATPSPVPSYLTEREKDLDISTADSYVTTASHVMYESNPLESPPKKLATEANVAIKKAYKDSVRARRSSPISATSSLSDDPNESMESIADNPITLINPRYSRIRRRSQSTESQVLETENTDAAEMQDIHLGYVRSRGRQRSMSTESSRGSWPLIEGYEREMDRMEWSKSPRGRRGIRSSGESTPLRSCSVTPERQDSPAVTSLRSSRISRSRSKTPELSPRSSPLPPIMEWPKQEVEFEPHAERSTLSVPRSLRSRSRTPERIDKVASESPRLEAIKESPTKSGGDSPPASHSRRSLRSRSRTPERIDKGVIALPWLEAIKESPTRTGDESPPASPSQRSLRSRSRTSNRIDRGASGSPRLETITKYGGDSPPASPSRRSLRSRSRTPERIDKGASVSPWLEAIKESPTRTGDESPPASPSRQSLRSRSRTPERIDKGASVSPWLEAIKESPTRTGDESPPASPSRQSLRSRSRTPERIDEGASGSPRLEAIKESPTRTGDDSPPASPSQRSLRSRSRTPVRINKGAIVLPWLEVIKESPTRIGDDSPPALPSRQSLRSRSRTPERIDIGVIALPWLEAIKESPTRTGDESPPASPSQRSLRSRSRTSNRIDRGASGSPRLETITKYGGDSPPASPSRRSLRSRSRTPERIDKGASVSPWLEAIKESPTRTGDESPPASPSRQSLRSRSRTPERIDKGASVSPWLEAIKESPTRTGDDSLPASPSRRSLRSRSRTPEVEVIMEPLVKPSPRSLRSRSKTPEKMSPKKEHSVRTKKSLSRLVLEANTFAKTKQTLELLEAETSSECQDAETREVAVECTPMKTLKPVPSLMDVTLSPIINKSILQSSNDSVLSESVDKEPKDKSNMGVSLTPLPPFAPILETYLEKSVLRSYQSSVGEFSQSITEEKEIVAESSDLIALPTFTTINEDFGQSVLHSYDSSVAETSHGVQETSHDVQDSEDVETPIKTNFGSVLHSQQSSIADTQPLNVSSLITDDSDVDMTETENREKAEQKEKEQIVEIEREIHEIEDMSNENESGVESSIEEESSEQSDVEVSVKTQDSPESSNDEFAANDNAIPACSDDSYSDAERAPPLFTIEMLNKMMVTFEPNKMEKNQSSQSSYKFLSSNSGDRFEKKYSDSNVSSQSKTNYTEPEESNQLKKKYSKPEDSNQSKKIYSESEDSNQSKKRDSESEDSNQSKKRDSESEDSNQSKKRDSESADSNQYKKKYSDSEDSNQSKKTYYEPEDSNQLKKKYSEHEDSSQSKKKDSDSEDSNESEDSNQSKKIDSESEDSNQSKKKDSDSEDSNQSEKKYSEPEDSNQSKKKYSEHEDSSQSKKIGSESEDSNQSKKKDSDSEDSNQSKKRDSESEDSNQSKKKDSDSEDSNQSIKKDSDSEDSNQSKKKYSESEDSNQSTKKNSEPEDSSQSKKIYSVSDDSSQSKKIESESDSDDSDDSDQTVEKHQDEQQEDIPTKMDVTLDQASDPLAQVSLMTEDNSGSEQELTLNYSDEAIAIEKAEVPATLINFNIKVQDIPLPEALFVPPSPMSVDVVDTFASETQTKEPEVVLVTEETKAEKINAKQQTVQKTFEETEQETYEESTKKVTDSQNVQESKPAKQTSIPVPETLIENKLVVETMDIEPLPETVHETSTPGQITHKPDVTDVQATPNPNTIQELLKPEPVLGTTKPFEESTELTVENMDTITQSQSSEHEVKQVRTRRRVKYTSSDSDIEPKETEVKTPTTRKRAQSRAKTTEIEITKDTIETEKSTSSSTSEVEVEPKTPARKRAQSKLKFTEIDSNMTKVNEPTNIEEQKTTRKGTTNELTTVTEEVLASNKTEMEIPKDEPKTPITKKRTPSSQSEVTTTDNVTPSRRIKTPTSTEVRKIITRRMSREMRELHDNESVVSDSSMASSVNSGESKPKRGRKSALVTKPDLSVIPEVLAEREQSTLDAINKYSGARRLTRNQKAVLETSRGGRRISNALSDRSSVSGQEDEVRQPAFDLQPIDRISLLSKESYDGPPDEDELQLSGMSPESIASDASRMRSRMARVASTAKVVKAAKVHRRIASIEVVDDSLIGSPAHSGTDSPARNRRASFNRAVEALQTPKGKRQSTDSRKSDISSPVKSPPSPEPETRRGRRASAHSNTSLSGKTRSKKK